MSNRSRRRAERKQAPKWEKMTKNQLMTRLTKNGITVKELEANYYLGQKAGIEGTYKICFAAVCLALNDLHGFGGKRCDRVLNKMQRYIIDSLSTAEAIEDVFERMGLSLDFGDPSSWVRLEDD